MADRFEEIAIGVVRQSDEDWETFDGRTTLPHSNWPVEATDLVDAIAAALREASALQPMATAPRDGTLIIGERRRVIRFNDKRDNFPEVETIRFANGRWENGNRWSVGGSPDDAYLGWLPYRDGP